jgi:hypothetical protein
MKIPDDVEAVVPIIVGVSRGPVSPVARKDPQILHWNRGSDANNS